MRLVKSVKGKEKMISWLHSLLASTHLSELIVEKNTPVLVVRLTGVTDSGNEEVVELDAECARNCEKRASE